jgi:hypothetical protein
LSVLLLLLLLGCVGFVSGEVEFEEVQHKAVLPVP